MNHSKYTHLTFNLISYFSYYRKTRKLLKSKNFHHNEYLRNFQFNKLKKIIEYAYKNVPYYTDLFNNIKFKPDDFQSLDDLKKIPFLTKDIIRNNYDKLVAKNFPKRHIKEVQTGGTTGLPLTFMLDKRYSTLNELVYLNHMWRRIGYKTRDKCVVLREDKIENVIEGKKYWQRNILTNWLIMSAIHLNADTYSIFYNKIQRFKPKFLIAFPSNIYLLAKFIKANNLSPIPSVKAVICSSENIYDWQRNFIEEIFNTKVFSYYGHSEKCILAAECSGSSNYEFYPQYGYVELINEKGDYCSKENEEGELIATGFNNFASPLIRYKTDDIGIYTSKCSEHNAKWFTIKKIVGRAQDFLIDKDKVPKSYIYIDRPFWDIRDKIFAYQYIQNKPGKVVLNIHSKEKLDKYLLEEIRKIFNKTYFKFDLEIKEVDHIPKTRSGKFKYLLQNIKDY